MLQTVKNKKKNLIVVFKIVSAVSLLVLISLAVFHNRYAPEHPGFDTFAAFYYLSMVFSFLFFIGFLLAAQSVEEDISDKKWFVAYFVPNAAAPPPFRLVVDAVDKEEVESKFRASCPTFTIIDISLK